MGYSRRGFALAGSADGTTEYRARCGHLRLASTQGLTSTNRVGSSPIPQVAGKVGRGAGRLQRMAATSIWCVEALEQVALWPTWGTGLGSNGSSLLNCGTAELGRWYPPTQLPGWPSRTTTARPTRCRHRPMDARRDATPPGVGILAAASPPDNSPVRSGYTRYRLAVFSSTEVCSPRSRRTNRGCRSGSGPLATAPRRVADGRS
jgi:hypothetical protein